MTGSIAGVSKVLETATSVTDARSRRASLQARAIASSTAARPVGECSVSEAFSEAIGAAHWKFDRLFHFYIFGTELLEGFPVRCAWGGKPACQALTSSAKMQDWTSYLESA